MRLMWHSVERQHYVRNFLDPAVSERGLEETSTKDVIDGPMAPLVHGIPFRVVWGGKELLNIEFL